jgi:hypothetical protein
MSNPNNYLILRASAKESGPAGRGTRLHIRKRSAANWALPVPEASFDTGDSTWEESLARAVRASGESVQFSADDLARLRAEANRILHPVAKNQRMSD